MDVEVDRDLCEANGVCVVTAPEVFDLDEQDVLQIAPAGDGPDLAERVRRAVAGCPRNALRFRA